MVRPYNQNDIVTIGFATGGAGYGDPLERDPAAVEEDLLNGIISESTASDPPGGVGPGAQAGRRGGHRGAPGGRAPGPPEPRQALRRVRARVAQKRPPEEILAFYGSWPDAKAAPAHHAALRQATATHPAARVRLLARSGRAQPGIFAPLVLAQAAEIEALASGSSSRIRPSWPKG